MRSASFLSSSDRPRESRGRRALRLLLVLAAHVLLLILVFRESVSHPSIPPKQDFKVFKVLSYTEQETAKPAPRASRSAGRPVPRSPAAPPVPKVPPPVVPPKPLNMLVLSKEDFAAADISKMPSHAAAADGAQGRGVGQDDGADTAGAGPGGEKLYNAEWYVEPTDAELDTYLPSKARQPGWAMIACHTIADYHVDDCRELDESPAGSGLARGLRLASWQFRVRPPRIGGRAMVGAWVRIRFDFKEKLAK